MSIKHICEKCGKSCEFNPFGFYANIGFVCEECDAELEKQGTPNFY